MKIVAIGGGELKTQETLLIDRFLVDFTGKRSPNALFIPTASGDAEGYCQTFQQIYGQVLGCRTDSLLLLNCSVQHRLIEDAILGADLIYVGGGNTLRMMKRWRQLGVDRLLAKAAAQGTVLSGISAGAICWHQWGDSDSRSFSGKQDWSYIRVRGLGLKPGLFCPHLDTEGRHESLLAMVGKYKMYGIACDDHAAVVYHDSRATCLASRKNARACVCRCDEGQVSIAQYHDGESLEWINALHTDKPRR